MAFSDYVPDFFGTHETQQQRIADMEHKQKAHADIESRRQTRTGVISTKAARQLYHGMSEKARADMRSASINSDRNKEDELKVQTTKTIISTKYASDLTPEERKEAQMEM